jgi:pilus assembly protein CpaF
VPARLAALAALGGLAPDAVVPLVASAIDLVVHLRRTRGGQRVVDEIALLRREGTELRIVPAWTRSAGAGPGAAELSDRLAARAVEGAPQPAGPYPDGLGGPARPGEPDDGRGSDTAGGPLGRGGPGAAGAPVGVAGPGRSGCASDGAP